MANWLGDTREDVLALARTWNVKLPLLAAKTGIDPAYLQTLTDDLMGAEASFRQATPENRSKVVTARMNETFGKLENTMTYIKKHWLNMPPLTKTEWTEIGLEEPDGTKTPAPEPTVPAGFDIEYSASGLVHITKIHPLGAGPFSKKQYSIIEVRFGLGGEPTPDRPLRFSDKLVPASGDVLPHGELTRRAAHKLVLPNEKGNVLYVAVRYRSTNLKTGPWSDVVKIIIP